MGALVAAVAQTGVAIWLQWRGQHDAAMLAAALIVTTAGLERLDPPLAGCVTSTGNLEVAVIATALPTLCALALLQHLIGQTLCDVLAAATARSEEPTHPDDGVAEIALAERTLRREIPRYALQKRFLARERQPGLAPVWSGSKRRSAMSPTCIAVIDDSLAVRPALQLVFDTRGYTVVFHPRAAGAVAFVQQQQPDLVIVDLHLEYPDAGLDVVRSLRADPATAPIPLVVWSADTDVERKVKSLGLADVAPISKYAGLTTLLDAVTRLTAASGADPAA